MILEYYRRMNCDEPKMLFSFDSSDSWMRKALLKRGWLENKNIHSKAFHLLWTYKFPKDTPFPEQRVNHYPNSYKLTAKSGLHNMLKKYNIQHLQPKTYDVDT
jgi:hypothetical protein